MTSLLRMVTFHSTIKLPMVKFVLHNLWWHQSRCLVKTIQCIFELPIVSSLHLTKGHKCPGHVAWLDVLKDIKHIHTDLGDKKEQSPSSPSSTISMVDRHLLDVKQYRNSYLGASPGSNKRPYSWINKVDMQLQGPGGKSRFHQGDLSLLLRLNRLNISHSKSKQYIYIYNICKHLIIHLVSW